MNKNIRNGLNNGFLIISRFFQLLVSTIISCLRVLVLTSPKCANLSKKYYVKKRYDNCCILANGPSLREAIDRNEVILDSVDVFCVNMFVQSPDFWDIKPRFYFILDGAFFQPVNEREMELVNTLRESLKKITWDMFLCVSSSCVNGGILEDLNNSHIKVLRWNTTTFEGFEIISNAMYSRGLSMPKCQTVINFSLCASVLMGYKKVYLYGADHSWTKDLRVDDMNIVCYGDRHIYNKDLSVIKLDCTIGNLLHTYANMFDSHLKINKFARSCGTRIINCTRGSFIDAYERYFFK